MNQGYIHSLGSSAFIFSLSIVFALIITLLPLGSDNYDITKLLTVGEDSDYRGWIEEDYGRKLAYSEHSHDGQFSYIIARRPFGDHEISSKLDSPQYRYRRILYPLLAGGAGHFDPRTTVMLLYLLQIVFFAVAVTAMFRVIQMRNYSIFALLFLFFHPGIHSSLRILNCETAAIAFSLLGLHFYLSKRNGLEILCFSCAALSKEVYLLFPLGIALYEYSQTRCLRSVHRFFLPALPITLWTLYLNSVLFEPASIVRGNLTLPFLGIAAAAPNWLNYETGRTAFSLASLTLASTLIFASRNRLYAYLIAPWVILAICSSSWVWDLGNNSARAFASLWILSGLAMAEIFVRRRSKATSTQSGNSCKSCHAKSPK
jgi:hypothetical protein